MNEEEPGREIYREIKIKLGSKVDSHAITSDDEFSSMVEFSTCSSDGNIKDAALFKYEPKIVKNGHFVKELRQNDDCNNIKVALTFLVTNDEFPESSYPTSDINLQNKSPDQGTPRSDDRAYQHEYFKGSKCDFTTISKRNGVKDILFTSLTNMSFMTRGSNSNIYTAHLKGYKRKVVLKILMMDPPDKELAFRDFLHETEIMSRLNHENVMGFYGGGKHTRSGQLLPFLVLQRLKGGTLKALLSKCTLSGTQQSFLPNNLVVNIGRSFASALNYLHNEFHPTLRCIHRDLKPDNIGFTEDGVLKLMDFGLCACVQRTDAANDTYMMTGYTGSLRYMAPEVVQYQPYNEKVDIYSFGIIMWQVATAITPFSDMDPSDFVTKVVTQGYRPPLMRIPNSLADIIVSCWDANPTQRMQTSDLFEAMQQLSSASPVASGDITKHFPIRNTSSFSSLPSTPKFFSPFPISPRSSVAESQASRGTIGTNDSDVSQHHSNVSPRRRSGGDLSEHGPVSSTAGSHRRSSIFFGRKSSYTDVEENNSSAPECLIESEDELQNQRYSSVSDRDSSAGSGTEGGSQKTSRRPSFLLFGSSNFFPDNKSITSSVGSTTDGSQRSDSSLGAMVRRIFST